MVGIVYFIYMSLFAQWSRVSNMINHSNRSHALVHGCCGYVRQSEVHLKVLLCMRLVIDVFFSCREFIVTNEMK